jgi:fibronectin-binding autotransporter adhesin
MRSTLLSRNPVARLAFAAAAVLASDARAATWMWDGVSGGWSIGDNWDSNTVPLSAADTSLAFGGEGATSYTATFDLASPFVLNALTLASSASVSEVIDGAGALDFRASAGAAPVIMQNGVGAFSISTGIEATDALTLSGGGTGVVTLGGVLGGGGGLTFLSGNWRIAGVANTITGGVTVGPGAVLDLGPGGGGNQNVDIRAAAAAILGPGTGLNAPAIDGGTLRLTTSGSGSLLVGRALTFGAGGGTLDLRNSNPANPTAHGGHITSGELALALNNTAPAVLRFNGGQLGLSDIASPNSGNWSLTGNALRLATATSGSGPLRVEVTNGALARAGTAGSQTLAIPAPITYRERHRG